MRNLLIIAHEFPPSAGGGVQRIAKIARYLPENGWSPTVLCASPVRGRPMDDTLLADLAGLDIVRLPSRDVAAAFASAYGPLKRVRALARRGAPEPEGTDGSRASSAATMQTPLSTRLVRRWFLDSAAVWARQVPRHALRLHRRTPFDAILASGPPPSALIAGARAAELCGVPLIADFRDGWMTRADFRWPNDPARDAASLAAERFVLAHASLTTAVSEPIADEVRGLGMADVLVLPNGYDPADLPAHAPQPGPLRVGFMGRFYGVTDPAPFFEGAALAIREDPACRDLIIDVVGPPSETARDVVAALGLERAVSFHGFLAHADALATMARADVGLVAIADNPGAEAIYTGKLFEYLGIGLPVLLVGPEDGVAAQLIREASAGMVVAYRDPQAVARALGRFAREKLAGVPVAAPSPSAIAPFDRRSQVSTLASALDRIVVGCDRE